MAFIDRKERMASKKKRAWRETEGWWARARGKELVDFLLKRKPPGAIQAHLDRQAPNNSYGPPLWYEDKRKTCVGCGKEFLFSAKEQQHWYEVLKLPIYADANRCAACRRKIRQAKAAQQRHMEEMARHPPHPNVEKLWSTKAKRRASAGKRGPRS